MLSSIISVAAGMLLPMAAEPADMADTLRAAAVVADRGIVVSRTDTVTLANTTSITDALKGIPGLLVTDNGGPAGLKTLSLRGLGSAHTAIYIDGVRVGNIQSGQVDLGMPDCSHYGSAAVDYAQNSISFNTVRPVFEGRNFAGSAGMRAGSFGTYEPSVRLDFRISDSVVMSATADGERSDGDFPYGEDGALRANNDISRIRSGLDVWGLMEGGDWHAKAYYNGSDRGTPGSIYWASTDRQNDRNAFVQGVARKQFSTLYQLSLSAKAAYDDLLYCSEWGDSDYKQKEFQINSTHKFTLTRWLDASLTADYQWDVLSSNLYEASRSVVVTTAAASFHPGRFKADTGIEIYSWRDSDGDLKSAVSPSVDLRWNVFEGFDVVAFGRRAYRVPTFNELYYPGYGNTSLRTEDAWLSDAGVDYHCAPSRHWAISAKADAFFNHLKDKITSAPSAEDPNIWMPYNIGIVRMVGADIESVLTWSNDDDKAYFTARYSFQDGVDKTPDGSSFGQQIPYIARHTVYLNAGFSVSGWESSVAWNLRSGRRDSYGEISDCNTLDLSVRKEFRLSEAFVMGLRLAALNLTDCRYELSSGYPMPGRSFHGEIDIKF